MTTTDPRQAGFSMVELLVAMVMTLIVSGAILGLLTGGQNAFRREPELTDRQQSIRVAMDLIKRDVAGAGAGMVPFVQAFTNGLNGAGGAPSSTQTSGAIGPGTIATDILEILTSNGQCSVATAVTAPVPAAAGPWDSNDTLPACFPDSGAANSFFYLGSGDPSERNAYGVRMGKASVVSGTFPFQIIIAGSADLSPTAVANPSAGFCNQIAGAGVTDKCTILMPIDVVRYRIAADPDDATLPALWRSRTGAFNTAGNAAATPGVGNGTWEVVARGIEDMQVQYFRGVGAGAWADTPGDVYCESPCTAALPTAPPDADDFGRVVRQVRVTLSARATTRARIQGGRTAAGGAANAIRGQLVAVMTPRAALAPLTLNTPPAWY